METGHSIVACPECGTKNKVVPVAGKRPLCASCGTHLPETMATPVTVTDKNFEEVVLRSSLPVLLDCWAPWCGPCRMVGPIVDQLAADFSGRLIVGKLNTDENPGVSGRFGIQSIPTLMIFKDAEMVERIVGAQPRQNLESALNKYL